MAQYTAAISNGMAVIINANTGEIIKTRERNGRAYVQLYYNGKSHTHTLAHAYALLSAGIGLMNNSRLHAHHADGNRRNDTPNNYILVCAAMHRAIHKATRV